MRPIPEDILDKLSKSKQTKANNANPSIKAYLSRGFINELFLVYSIQSGENVEAVGVTAKRLLTASIPEEAFAVCLDNGVATIKSKPLPYDELVPWTDEFSFGTGIVDAEIEFDGYWEFNRKEGRYNFVTEEVPWIFWVSSDNALYAQLWTNEPILLAVSVTKIACIRGWIPANSRTPSNDQGLVVAYIKTDGSIYYRNYCVQEDETVIWEVERKVGELTGTYVDLAIFRTNDFRIGFVVQDSLNQLYWLVTERTYAGMSAPPHYISGWFGGLTSIVITHIDYADLSAENVNLSGSLSVPCIGINLESDTVGVLSDGELLSEYEIRLSFTQKIVGDISRIGRLISLSNMDGTIVYDAASTLIGETDKELIIISSTPMDLEVAVYITVPDGAIYLSSRKSNMLPMAAFTTSVTLSQEPYHNAYLSGRLNVPVITITEVFRSSVDGPEESISGWFGGLTSIILTKVGGGDV